MSAYHCPLSIRITRAGFSSFVQTTGYSCLLLISEKLRVAQWRAALAPKVVCVRSQETTVGAVLFKTALASMWFLPQLKCDQRRRQTRFVVTRSSDSAVCANYEKNLWDELRTPTNSNVNVRWDQIKQTMYLASSFAHWRNCVVYRRHGFSGATGSNGEKTPAN